MLVGHSYGGNVISTAAIGNDQVQALVYFNGWRCDVGESQQQLLERFVGESQQQLLERFSSGESTLAQASVV